MIIPDIDNTELNSTLNCVSFSEEIEFNVLNKVADGYMSAIINFCEEHEFEYSDVVKYISPSLKDKIRLEAEESGLTKRRVKLGWEF